MISLSSAFRPVSPVSAACHKVQKPSCRASSLQAPEQDTVQFGYGWYSSYRTVSLAPDTEYVTGFTPNKTIGQLFRISRGPAAMLIDRQGELDRWWDVVGLPKRDKLTVDWKKEVVILAAIEKSGDTDSMPHSIKYNGYREILEVTLPGERKRGRNPGVAWYIGKVSNTSDSEQSRYDRDWNILGRNTRVYVRTIREDG